MVYLQNVFGVENVCTYNEFMTGSGFWDRDKNWTIVFTKTKIDSLRFAMRIAEW